MTEAINHFSRGGAEFTVDLLNKLKEAIKAQENILISPFSIQACMALACIGAEGETAHEISHALKYNSKTAHKVASDIKHVMKKYHGNHHLKMANKVYVEKGHKIKEEYETLIKHKFHIAPESLNFAEKQLAANTINAWVEHKTNGKISDLVSCDSLDAETRLLLVNALHFKGEWKEKFDKSKTKLDDFWISQDESVKVEYMNQTKGLKFGFINELQCRALEMPYKDCDLSMFVLLPGERDGLLKLLDKLKAVNLLDLAKFVEKYKDDDSDDDDDDDDEDEDEEDNERDVVVQFPKFQVDYSMELSNVLKEMGITTAFTPHADFSNMLESPQGVCVSNVFHKTSIEVNEEGTEAVASTYMTAMDYCMPPYFIADHPFVYFIWNRETILFAGTFVNVPTKK